MTVRRPLYLQALTAWSADDDRRVLDALFNSPGVIAGGLAVGPNSPVGMSVIVQPGYVIVPAKTATKGKYLGQVTVAEVPTIAAASAFNRVDIVIAQVLDTVDGADASDVLQIVSSGVSAVCKGTVSGLPPATPAGSVLLATVSVLTSDTTIPAARITDVAPSAVPGRLAAQVSRITSTFNSGASSTLTNVASWNSTDFTDTGMTGGASGVTVPVAGTYRMTMYAEFAPSAGGIRRVICPMKNGSEIASHRNTVGFVNATFGTGAPLTVSVTAAAGDVLNMGILQDSGGVLAISVGAFLLVELVN